ncbi:MAG: DUF3667 domain-containing protein [Colwellia sp.]|nr:DUF3667 domain-containing protein [Colwellia sp.]
MPNTDLVEKDIDVDVASMLPKAADDFKSAEGSVCENCHQPINGPFCAQCGQQAESTLKYFWVVIMHLLDDIFSFDSRAARTLLPLVTRPGFLTNEYFSGRRVHYVPPLRLYLFISIVFFITLNLFITADNNILNINDNQTVITEIKDHIKLLKEKQLTAKETNTDNSAELGDLSSNIIRFSTYLTDINKDYTIKENKHLIDMTKRLVDLELDRFHEDEAFSPRKNERYNLFASNIKKIKNGEYNELNKNEKEWTIQNNEDGTLSFDFLSDDSNKRLDAFAKSLVKKAQKALNSDTTPIVQEAIEKLPQLMFILLPLFAALLKIMFLFSKRLYMEHLTVALHSHSFIFFTILLVELLDVFYEYSVTALPALSGTIEFIGNALMIWIPIYLFIMQKRVYKQGYFFTFLKYSFIGSAYMMLIGLTGVIAFIWGLTDA